MPLELTHSCLAFSSQPEYLTDDSSSEDGEDESDETGRAQHVVVLLDCRGKMMEEFLPDPHHPERLMSPMDLAVKACDHLVRDGIRNLAKRDGFGLVLYNTRKRPRRDADEQSTTVHELISLGPPGKDAVRTIRSAHAKDASTGRRLLDLRQEYSHNADAVDAALSFELALAKAREMFGIAASFEKQGSNNEEDTTSLWIFTNDGDPAMGRPDIAAYLQTRITEVQDDGIDIMVWPLPTKVRVEFRFDKFYRDICNTRAPPSNADCLEVLLDDLRIHWKPTQRVFGAPLLMPGWKDHPERQSIMLDFYQLVQPCSRPATVMMGQESKKYLEPAASRAVSAASREYIEVGGERIPMSNQDKRDIIAANNTVGFRSLLLLGFKDKSAVPFTTTLGPSYVVYPNDAETQGGGSAFVHLHASMLRKDVIAIGELLTSPAGMARLVAISPLEADDKDDGGSTRPPRMMVVALPFQDDIRESAYDAAVEELESDGPAVAIVRAAMALVEKQDIRHFAIDQHFENASLTRSTLR